MLQQLLAHLSLHSLLNPHQSACRAAHSTETALLKVTNDLLTASDDDKVSILVLLNFSAASGTIDNSLLLNRTQHFFGISESVLSWFPSYLTDRKQSVCENGLYSSPSMLKLGVPHGSVLSPVPFTLYVSPMSNVIQKHVMKHKSFDYNTQLQLSGYFTQCQDLVSFWIFDTNTKYDQNHARLHF